MKEGMPIPTNKINRAANIAIAHGVFVGNPRIYREHGVPRPSKEKMKQGIIFEKGGK